MAFFSYSATRLLNLFCNCRSAHGKKAILHLLEIVSFQPSYYGTLFTSQLIVVSGCPSCVGQTLTSGDPVKILLISSLPSLSLPSLFTSSCSSKGATHFLSQCTPLVGMDTPFPCPSLKGRYQALSAVQGLGTCILPQHL